MRNLRFIMIEAHKTESGLNSGFMKEPLFRRIKQLLISKGMLIAVLESSHCSLGIGKYILHGKQALAVTVKWDKRIKKSFSL